MAAITKTGTPSLATALPSPEHIHGGKLAGEAIAAGDLVYVNADNKVYRANGAAANAAARVRGIAPAAASAGRAVSIYWGVTFRYGTGLTPGIDVFLSGTVPGGLDTVASVGGVNAVGYVIDATRVHIFSPR